MPYTIPALEFEERKLAQAIISRERLEYSQVHSHTFFEFEFAISGEIHHMINNAVTTFRGGDVCFLSPAAIHHFYSDATCPGVERYCLIFEAAMISNTVWQSINVEQLPFTVHLDGEKFDMLRGVFETLLARAEKKVLPSTQFVRATVEWIILYLFDRLPPAAANPNTSLLQPALLYIQNSFRGTLSVEEAAQTIPFSVAHFSRLFHKHMGISYREYVLMLRLSYAYAYSYKRDVTVTDMCYDSGFNSPEYFSRAFKKEFGFPPEDILRKNRAYHKAHPEQQPVRE